MTSPSAVAIRRSPEVRQAQDEQRAAETSHFLAARGLRKQIAKARGQDYKQMFPPAKPTAPNVPPGPMPQTGIWRCNRKSTCKECAVGTCKSSSDPDRQKNSCPCHQKHPCLEWDSTAPCRTSYEEAPPGARAKVTKPPSIASTVGVVSADSLAAAKQNLITAAQNMTEKKTP